MIDLIIGWVSVALGVAIPIPQLMKLWKHKGETGVSILTYIFIVLYLNLSLLHAIYIRDVVFITTHSCNLVTNSLVLTMLIKRKRS